jgi:hypothetical protein
VADDMATSCIAQMSRDLPLCQDEVREEGTESDLCHIQ